MAVRADHLQGVGDHQGHIHRRDGVHADCPERGPVLRHRGPDAQAARVRRRPAGHQIHRDRGRDHMVPGRGVRHARRRVLVHQTVRGEQRDAVRGLLPVPGRAGPRLSARHGHRPVPGVLRGPAVRHHVLLRHDGQAPDQQHQEHARRSASKESFSPKPRFWGGA